MPTYSYAGFQAFTDQYGQTTSLREVSFGIRVRNDAPQTFSYELYNDPAYGNATLADLSIPGLVSFDLNGFVLTAEINFIIVNLVWDSVNRTQLMAIDLGDSEVGVVLGGAPLPIGTIAEYNNFDSRIHSVNNISSGTFAAGETISLAAIDGYSYAADSPPTQGDDILFGTSGADLINALGGDDNIDVASGNDTVLGGQGDDQIRGGGGADRAFGGAGNDTIFGGYGDDLAGGGTGADNLVMWIGNDTAFGSDGFDTLSGEAGDDVLWGGRGQDRAFGGDGNDRLGGGAGVDRLWGGAGHDTIFGGDDSDLIGGGDWSDRLYGGIGNDTVFGGQGNDTVYGEAGNDVVGGSEGDDWVYGAGGADTIFGGDGSDHLIGGDGEDRLLGGLGHDTLDGGNNFNVLIGGWGDDTFIFSCRRGIITDFGKGDDILDLRAADGISGFSDLMTNHAAQTNGGVLITTADGATLTLAGVETSDLSVSDFIF